MLRLMDLGSTSHLGTWIEGPFITTDIGPGIHFGSWSQHLTTPVLGVLTIDITVLFILHLTLPYNVANVYLLLQWDQHSSSTCMYIIVKETSPVNTALVI